MPLQVTPLLAVRRQWGQRIFSPEDTVGVGLVLDSLLGGVGDKDTIRYVLERR